MRSPKMKACLKKIVRTSNCFWIFYDVHENCNMITWLRPLLSQERLEGTTVGAKDQEIAITSDGGLTRTAVQEARLLQGGFYIRTMPEFLCYFLTNRETRGHSRKPRTWPSCEY